MKKEAMLYKKLENNAVRCRLCAHHCKIEDSEFGFCGVRQNIGGTLYSLVYAETIARHVDPIEKKPLYHFLPGSLAYSIATVGCNFRCSFCQNWQISQVTGEADRIERGVEFPPGQVVAEARRHDCASIAYTYTEPTIFFEYAYETAKLAADAEMHNVFVTHGYMTRQALDTIAPYLNAANVDLKAWREDYYRDICRAHIKPVLDSIAYLKKLGIWVEVTTLVVPQENDSDDELEGIAGFIAGVDRGIPWHISRFRPDYRFGDHSATPMATLKRAAEIGKSHGLHYVYLGNVAADIDTICPACGKPVVNRTMGGVSRTRISDGRCAHCGFELRGVWR
jgi:pyruvate formate lyase activating enzyme